MRGAMPSRPAAAPASTAWTPFRHKLFTVLWVGTVVSNIGTWMQNAAAGWFMTNLSPSPLSVALVQAASTLPMFLFALPAGGLADIVDRRRLLVAMQIAGAGLSTVFAVALALDLGTAQGLLAFIFLSGVAAVLAAPAWQAIVPQLVPHEQLSPAVALNSVGMNISRAIGPALAGLSIATLGMASPFWINGAMTLVAVATLLWWRPEPVSDAMPPERFGSAVRAGLRFARHNRHLRATLVRAAGFFPLASVYWALLPLVARQQIAGGPELYGILLGAIGVGAVAGAALLPAVKTRLGADGVLTAATLVTALSVLLFAFAREPVMALVACVLGGAAWIAAIATLNVSAQVALPAWVRGRGLAVFASVQFAGLALGSILWGQAAQSFGLSTAHMIAALALVAVLPLLRRWHVQTGAGLDLTPSLHWPTPVLAQAVEADRGPVLVTVEYVVASADRDAFRAAIARLAHERRRDGAYEWNLYEDAANPGTFVETFQVDSWLEHMRQHHRVTNADRVIQDAVQRFHAEGTPLVRHLIAAQRNDKP
jgi:MFS family permease